MRQFSILAISIMLLVSFTPTSFGQGAIDPQLDLSCEKFDFRTDIAAESYPYGYAEIQCTIFNPNDYRVSVEIDWDWDLIVEVSDPHGQKDYEKNENVEINNGAELLVNFRLNAEKYESWKILVLEFHGTITHYFQEGLVACASCERETVSNDIEVEGWADFQIYIVQSDLPGKAQGDIFQVCTEEILSGTYSATVSIDYDSNIDNPRFRGELEARGRYLHDDGGYASGDFYSNENIVESNQNSNTGNFTMELKLEMTEDFVNDSSISLTIKLLITATSGTDYYGDYERFVCNEEFLKNETSMISNPPAQDTKNVNTPALSYNITILIILIAFMFGRHNENTY